MDRCRIDASLVCGGRKKCHRIDVLLLFKIGGEFFSLASLSPQEEAELILVQSRPLVMSDTMPGARSKTPRRQIAASICRGRPPPASMLLLLAAILSRVRERYGRGGNALRRENDGHFGALTDRAF